MVLSNPVAYVSCVRSCLQSSELGVSGVHISYLGISQYGSFMEVMLLINRQLPTPHTQCKASYSKYKVCIIS